MTLGLCRSGPIAVLFAWQRVHEANVYNDCSIIPAVSMHTVSVDRVVALSYMTRPATSQCHSPGGFHPVFAVDHDASK